MKDFGPEPGEALLAALKSAEANGGGIVYLPRGRYPVKGALTIPPHTILRGEAMELVNLYWPDFDDPPEVLITGEKFGIEQLTLYCQQHRNVITDTPASQRFFARRVRIRANCFFMIEDVGKEFRGRHGPASHRKSGAAHDSIVAGNRGGRMDGFLVWGLNPHGWGQQPSWGCQFLDNEIVEGNGYGHRSASFGIVSGNGKPRYHPIERRGGYSAFEGYGRLYVGYSNSGGGIGRVGTGRELWNNNSAEMAVIPVDNLKSNP